MGAKRRCASDIAIAMCFDALMQAFLQNVKVKEATLKNQDIEGSY